MSTKSTTTKKICRVCEQVLESSNNNFGKGKAVCRTCYSNKNKEKYWQRKQLEKQQKEIEIKAVALEEYGVLVKENKELKSKLETFGNALIETHSKLKELTDNVNNLLKQQEE
mgnify:CR=1 FL=1